MHTGDRGHQLAWLVLAVSLVGLHSVSSLYHSVPWPQVWNRRMQRLDHSLIYVLVAGTYDADSGAALVLAAVLVGGTVSQGRAQCGI